MTQKTPHFSEPEIVSVATDKIACDGGNGAIGHPRVWLPFYADKDFVECPYCDRRFVRNANHVASGQ